MLQFKWSRQGRWNQVKIYLDSYMAATFWLHLLCLYLVGILRKNRKKATKRGRLALAALLCAGIDTITLVFTASEIVQGHIFLVAMALLGLTAGAWIAYGASRIIQNSGLLFLITVLLAGFFELVPVRNVGVFCLVGTLLLPVLRTVIECVFRGKQTETLCYQVKLYQNEEEKCLSAFMDTGNRLRLYGSKLPVVLVDEMYLTAWIKAAEENMPQNLVFLPYKGVGGKGLLHGIRLHCRLLTERGELFLGEVAAVAAEHKLFSGCDYQMLLQPEVLTMECVKDAQKGKRDVV